MMKINNIADSLRKQLIDYRFMRKTDTVSIHINAIEIALCLVEYNIKEKRPISVDEQRWFDASYNVSYILDGSEWEILSILYSQLVTEVKYGNYYK